MQEEVLKKNEDNLNMTRRQPALQASVLYYEDLDDIEHELRTNREDLIEIEH